MNRFLALFVKLPGKFLERTSGNAAIEFALVLPLYTLLISNVYEIVSFSLIQNKMTRLAHVMGDTISRQNLTRITLQELLAQAPTFLEPFSFAPGQIVVSQMRNKFESNNPAEMIISWQESYNGGASEFGGPGETPSPLPNNLTLVGEQTILVTEVRYNYSSLTFGSVIGNQQLKRISIDVPRGDKMNTLLGG